MPCEYRVCVWFRCLVSTLHTFFLSVHKFASYEDIVALNTCLFFFSFLFLCLWFIMFSYFSGIFFSYMFRLTVVIDKASVALFFFPQSVTSFDYLLNMSHSMSVGGLCIYISTCCRVFFFVVRRSFRIFVAFCFEPILNTLTKQKSI